MSIAIIFEDALGVDYDLTQPNAVQFDNIQLSEIKTVQAYVKNTDPNRAVDNVIITPVAHPTEQLGTAEDTYDSTTLSDAEGGLYTPTLSLGTLAAGSITPIWIRWTVGSGASPGWGFYALQAEGEYVL